MLASAYTEVVDAYALANTDVCTIDLCLQEYQTAVENDNPRFQMISSSYGVKFSKPDEGHFDNDEFYCWVQGLLRGLRLTTIDVRDAQATDIRDVVFADPGRFAFCETVVSSEYGVHSPRRERGRKVAIIPSSNATALIAAKSSDEDGFRPWCEADALCGTTHALEESQRDWTSDIFLRTHEIRFSQVIDNVAKSLTQLRFDLANNYMEGDIEVVEPHVKVR